MRIGFDTNERNKIFTHRIPYSHDDYEACSFLNLLKPLINESFTFNENVPFAKPSSDFPANLLTATGKERDKIISIFPGASVPERRLETGKFVKVAHVFSERGYSIVLLGSANEKRISAKIKEAIADCVDLTDKISLGQTAAVLKASGLLLTADSGLMHLAYAIGTPTVSIFGSGIEKKWAPRGDMHITINKRLSCSPCTRFGHTPRCALGIKCISLIEADEIVCAMERILNQNPR
jgi:ADP-heptose:LPS heptosyltransferase